MPLPQWRGLFWMFNSTFHARNYWKKRPLCACHKGIWRSGRIPPLILNLFTRWTMSTFITSNEILISTEWGSNELDSRSERHKPLVSRVSNHVSSHEQSSAFLFPGATAPSWPGPPHYRGSSIILRHITLGRTQDEWSARCRYLYLTTHSTHKRQTSMSLAGLEPAIPATKRPQPQALDGVSTEIGNVCSLVTINYCTET
jgi:hypothetical protein